MGETCNTSGLMAVSLLGDDIMEVTETNLYRLTVTPVTSNSILRPLHVGQCDLVFISARLDCFKNVQTFQLIRIRTFICRYYPSQYICTLCCV